jgi:hypothetical protein
MLLRIDARPNRYDIFLSELNRLEDMQYWSHSLECQYCKRKPRQVASAGARGTYSRGAGSSIISQRWNEQGDLNALPAEVNENVIAQYDGSINTNAEKTASMRKASQTANAEGRQARALASSSLVVT